jgi:hypothetical protein
MFTTKLRKGKLGSLKLILVILVPVEVWGDWVHVEERGGFGIGGILNLATLKLKRRRNNHSLAHFPF